MMMKEGVSVRLNICETHTHTEITCVSSGSAEKAPVRSQLKVTQEYSFHSARRCSRGTVITAAHHNPPQSSPIPLSGSVAYSVCALLQCLHV